jgi:DNA-binding response OmpR family regulator
MVAGADVLISHVPVSAPAAGPPVVSSCRSTITDTADAEAFPVGPVKRILFVEDHADTCDLLAFLLGKEGYLAECAATMHEALARPDPFDLYVIDHGLPDGDGFALCRTIRRLHPKARVVIYSARDDREHHKAAAAAGAHAYVNKPHVRHLATTIKDLLR